MFWLTAVGQLNCEPPVHCALTVGAFCLYWGSYCSQQTVALAFQPAVSPGTVSEEDGYNIDNHAIVTICIAFSKIFSVQAYRHLLTVLSSIITHNLNLWVYDSILVLLDAVCLYRIYGRLDTLPIYLYYELLMLAIWYKWTCFQVI